MSYLWEFILHTREYLCCVLVTTKVEPHTERLLLSRIYTHRGILPRAVPEEYSSENLQVEYSREQNFYTLETSRTFYNVSLPNTSDYLPEYSKQTIYLNILHGIRLNENIPFLQRTIESQRKQTVLVEYSKRVTSFVLHTIESSYSSITEHSWRSRSTPEIVV